MNGGDESELARLMRSAIAGEERAYAEFLRQTACLVRIFARRKIMQGGIDPEDIVQETLLAIHMKRHTWRDDAPIKPWVYAIARYKLVDAFRHRGRRLEINIDEIAELHAAPEIENSQRSGDRSRSRSARTRPALRRGSDLCRRALDWPNCQKPGHERGGRAGCAPSRSGSDHQALSTELRWTRTSS